MTRVSAVIVCLLLLSRLTAAAEPVPLPAQQARAVLAAFVREDAEALVRLARADEPDPWLVADALCARSAHDAALAFAQAAPRPDVERLPAWIEGRRDARGTVGDAFFEVRRLLAIGKARAATGGPREAVDALRRAAGIAERMGWLVAAARARRDAGRLSFGADDPDAAEADWMSRLALERRRRSPLASGDTFRDLALVDVARGAYAPALARLGEARTLHGLNGAPVDEAIDLDLLADVHLAMGDPDTARTAAAHALALLEGAGRPTLEGAVLCRLARIHVALQEEGKALGALDRALELARVAKDSELEATVLTGQGDAHLALDEPEAARERFEQARALGKESACGARALLGLAEVRRREGDLRGALALQERALAACAGNGTPRTAVHALASMALTRRYLGDHEGAQALYARARDEATRIGARDLVVRTLWGSATTHLEGGDRTRAADHAREAIQGLPGVVGGLSEEQGAAARSGHAGMFAVGARAALALGDLERLCFFLESGRAGTLLEFLGQREALQAVLVSKALLDAEAAARAREAEALERHREVRNVGGRRKIRAARRALDEARADLKAIIERIQREAKAQVGALRTPPSSLEEIAARVGPREALVLYGVFEEEALALVIRRDPASAHAVKLAPTAALSKAFRQFLLDDPEDDPTVALARLRALVVEPLGLGEDVTRVLVSPDGVLSYAPFAPLLPGRDVVCVPSGTTLGVLLREKDKRGEGVLALGDPAYDTNADPRVTSTVRSGVDLAPLPFTREEALAVGDVVLLANEATEAGFRFSVGKRRRWRAVHIACHGVMDPERPTLSALALTTADRDDGFLTALDVFRLKVPSDLVVLSACDSGVGRIVNAEGVLGLMRAFLFAGAPRVIVSLGRVDDAATRVLMEELYRRWNAGEDAATALRRAQEHVQSNARWAHPHYWGNWVLWGLGD